MRSFYGHRRTSQLIPLRAACHCGSGAWPCIRHKRANLSPALTTGALITAPHCLANVLCLHATRVLRSKHSACQRQPLLCSFHVPEARGAVPSQRPPAAARGSGPQNPVALSKQKTISTPMKNPNKSPFSISKFRLGSVTSADFFRGGVGF